MRYVVLGIGLAALAACGSDRTGTIEDDEGNTVDYAIGEDGETTTAEIQTADGNASIRSGANVAVDLPDGFSIYPGADVVNTTRIDGAQGSGTMVTLESDSTPEQLAHFYRKQADAAGVKVQMDMTTENGKMIAGQSEQGISFSLNASRDGDTTSAQLMIGREPGR
jgi:hypothetical protein